MNADPMLEDNIPTIDVPTGTTCVRHSIPGGIKFFVKSPSRRDATDETLVADMRSQARALGFQRDGGMEGPYYYDGAGNNLDEREVFKKGAAGIQVGCIYKFYV